MTESEYSQELWAQHDSPLKWERMMHHDWANPSRYLAFYLVADHVWKKERRYSFAEIGFGDAHDFQWGWRLLHDRKYIDYTGHEIMAHFALYASIKFSEYQFRQGGFMDLAADSYDVTYTRHTLEHSNPKLWKKCLAKLLKAMKELCIITWYMPPWDSQPTRENWTGVSWQNAYCRQDVMKIIDAMGFMCTVWPVGTNELWALERGK